jgi:thioredoxin reductase (NADPH)
MATSDTGAAFPTLDDTQMAALARCSEAPVRRYSAGQTLFEVGERDFKFFVVKTGQLEIVDTSGETPRTVAIHGPGEFTGDVAHLTGSPSVVKCIARSDAKVYEISAETLRHLLNKCPALGDVILRAFIARRQLLRSSNFAGLRVIGSRYSRDTHRIREFLARNLVPFTWLDLEEHREVDSLLQRFGVGPADTPIVVSGQTVLRNPTNKMLADAIGICRPLEQTVYDLAIVGCGPAGLAAAVYGASEGLRTVVLERSAPGGQAAGSMRIENYLGFPAGITGGELTERAVLQARKFGAYLSVPAPVSGLTFDATYSVLRLEGGETVAAKSLFIASGVDYRRLSVEGGEQFEGLGVYHAATTIEAELCRGSNVVVVGGGNSAGQAAVFLAENVRKVFLVIRASDLRSGMSSYLAWRIEQTPNIEVLFGTTVHRLSGDTWLRSVEIVDERTGQRRTIDTPALFSFIGAVPRTSWLPREIALDGNGFILTGTLLDDTPNWTAKRQPFLLETSYPGVFAGGDVRSGSVKRVATAVGEGAMAVQFVHEYLKQM